MPLFFYFLIALMLTSCSPKFWELKSIKGAFLELDEQVSSDSSVIRQFFSYKQLLDSSMNEVIGCIETDMPLVKSGAYETLLGNFAADVILSQAQKIIGKKPDLSVITTGGLRIPLYRGQVTVGTMFEFQPFDNEMVILEIEGKHLYELFEYHLQRKNTAIGNAKIVFESGNLSEALINGKPYDPEKVYTVVISDYLADGGDEMKFWQKSLRREYLYVKAREMFIDYFKAISAEGKQATASLENRFVVR
ncbi:MAG: 5'-nucleotidase C-terminal domain-containing protein [Cytophagales bacterium]|nr:5'-nucleotidase C-terminal domain-containing protein [Cytophagales bacterium]MDW8384445.1 5'-nucleotidase [Flammeovirgaceae bacterium]